MHICGTNDNEITLPASQLYSGRFLALILLKCLDRPCAQVHVQTSTLYPRGSLYDVFSYGISSCCKLQYEVVFPSSISTFMPTILANP